MTDPSPVRRWLPNLLQIGDEPPMAQSERGTFVLFADHARAVEEAYERGRREMAREAGYELSACIINWQNAGVGETAFLGDYRAYLRAAAGEGEK